MKEWTPEEIKALRKELGVTQAVLASRLDVSRTTVALCEQEMTEDKKKIPPGYSGKRIPRRYPTDAMKKRMSLMSTSEQPPLPPRSTPAETLRLRAGQKRVRSFRADLADSLRRQSEALDVSARIYMRTIDLLEKDGYAPLPGRFKHYRINPLGVIRRKIVKGLGQPNEVHTKDQIWCVKITSSDPDEPRREFRVADLLLHVFVLGTEELPARGEAPLEVTYLDGNTLNCSLWNVSPEEDV